MSNTTVSSYIDYFRQMAIRHKDIEHNINAESGNGLPGTCGFARWGADEVITGLRTSIGNTCLLLEMYEIGITNESIIDLKGNYSAAFSIVNKAEKKDAADEERAYALCEQIMFNILNKMWQDNYGGASSFCTSPFQELDFNQMQIMPLGPIIDNRFGWRCEFHFTFKQNEKIVQPLSSNIFS